MFVNRLFIYFALGMILVIVGLNGCLSFNVQNRFKQIPNVHILNIPRIKKATGLYLLNLCY